MTNAPARLRTAKLADLLRAAASAPCWTVERAVAWRELLAADFEPRAIAAAGRTIRAEGLDFFELSPLFCRLAAVSPADVAKLFPDALAPCVVPLCGVHGLRAALAALASDVTHREAAALALQDLVAAGFAVPPEPLRAALAKESQHDVREGLLSILSRQPGAL